MSFMYLGLRRSQSLLQRHLLVTSRNRCLLSTSSTRLRSSSAPVTRAPSAHRLLSPVSVPIISCSSSEVFLRPGGALLMAAVRGLKTRSTDISLFQEFSSHFAENVITPSVLFGTEDTNQQDTTINNCSDNEDKFLRMVTSYPDTNMGSSSANEKGVEEKCNKHKNKEENDEAAEEEEPNPELKTMGAANQEVDDLNDNGNEGDAEEIEGEITDNTKTSDNRSCSDNMQNTNRKDMSVSEETEECAEVDGESSLSNVANSDAFEYEESRAVDEEGRENAIEIDTDARPENDDTPADTNLTKSDIKEAIDVSSGIIVRENIENNEQEVQIELSESAEIVCEEGVKDQGSDIKDYGRENIKTWNELNCDGKEQFSDENCTVLHSETADRLLSDQCPQFTDSPGLFTIDEYTVSATSLCNQEEEVPGFQRNKIELCGGVGVIDQNAHDPAECSEDVSTPNEVQNKTKPRNNDDDGEEKIQRVNEVDHSEVLLNDNEVDGKDYLSGVKLQKVNKLNEVIDQEVELADLNEAHHQLDGTTVKPDVMTKNEKSNKEGDDHKSENITPESNVEGGINVQQPDKKTEAEVMTTSVSKVVNYFESSACLNEAVRRGFINCHQPAAEMFVRKQFVSEDEEDELTATAEISDQMHVMHRCFDELSRKQGGGGVSADNLITRKTAAKNNKQEVTESDLSPEVTSDQHHADDSPSPEDNTSVTKKSRGGKKRFRGCVKLFTCCFRS